MCTVRHVRLGVFFVLVAFAVSGAAVVSCGTTEGWVWDCNDPTLPAFAQDGTPNPCPRAGAGIDSGPPALPQCDGVCVPQAANVDFEEKPVRVWYGDSAKAPTVCPDDAVRTELRAEPISVDFCPICACGDPACVLPVGMSASTGTDTCAGPTYIPFAAKPNGACSDNMMTPIQANDSKSLALLAPAVTPCVPKTVILKHAIANWVKAGIVCGGVAHGECAEKTQVCVPKVPDDPPGFMQCVKNTTRGNETIACPAGYTDKQILLYTGIDYKLACTPCECDPPLGSDCTAKVSVYTNPSCILPSEFQSNSVPLGAPQCLTVPPNYAVEGMTEDWIMNKPGTCIPKGGDLTGKIDVDHSTAHMYCCRIADGGP